jgi:bacterial/archaeal transporter family protein
MGPMWFVLSLVAGFLFATNRLIVRSVLAKKVNPLAFGAMHEIIAGLLLLPIALFNFKFPQSSEGWIALGLVIFCIFLADVFSFYSLKYTEASIFQIVGQLRHGIVLLGAYLLFSEAVTLSKILSIVFIMTGVVIALMEKSKIQITRGVVYAILAAISIAFGFLFIKKASIEVPVFSLSAIALMSAGVLTYLLLLLQGGYRIKLIDPKTRKELFITSALFSIFEVCLFTALSIGEASRVTPVTQSSMIFTLIGGYIFLNERIRLQQKIIGSILIATGIGLLYFI